MLKGKFWHWIQSLSGGSRRHSAIARRRRPIRSSTPVLEGLEDRLTPAAPLVSSIARVSPPVTGAASVDFTVTFDLPVNNVQAGNFEVSTTGTARADGGIVVTPQSLSVYTLTVTGVHGNGDLRLDLVDDDTIVNGGDPLGGPGLGNGSFQGDSYKILQDAPSVVSIDRFNPTDAVTSATSVGFVVTFSKPVNGVDDSDFAAALVGPTANAPTVFPLTQSVYLVTVANIVGVGTVGLNLVDDGTITDDSGNRLASRSGPVFGAAGSVTTDTNPFAAAVADFDGDGIKDVAVASYLGNTVAILLGNGDGTFFAAPSQATDTNPRSVAADDVDGDGIVDLVVANYGSDTLIVYLGSGNGGFTAQTPIPVGVKPASVAIGDLNGDGKPDLAVANYGSNSLSILLGNGAGVFAARPDIAVGASPFAVAIGDVNGDGDPDLVTANYGAGTVSVVIGDGVGGFATAVDFAAGSLPSSVAIGDIDNDGFVDLAVANNSARTVSLLFGAGGTFNAPVTLLTGSNPFSALLADVNSDGFLDVAAGNFGDRDVFGKSPVSLFLGNGDRTFQNAAQFSVGSGPLAVLMSDFNGDGRPDLLSVDYLDNTVSVLLNQTIGDFAGQIYEIVPAPPSVVSIDRGTPAAPGTSNAVVTFEVAFSQPVTGVDVHSFRVIKDDTLLIDPLVVVAGAGADYTVTVSGISGYGKLGLELIDDDSIQNANGRLGGVGVGNGSYQGESYDILQGGPSVLSIVRTTPPTAVTNQSTVVFTVTFDNDVNGVDAADFLVVAAGLTANAPTVAKITGSIYTVTVTGIVGDGTLGLNLVDDGTIEDAATAAPLGSRLAQIAFAPTQTFAAGANLAAAIIVDVSGDGRPDLITANNGSNSISVLLGNGDGTFQTQTAFGAGVAPRDVASGDFNGDGLVDLVVANYDDGTVSILLGNGNGAFQPQQVVIAGQGPTALAVADFNGDGKADLAVAALVDNAVAILLGDGSGGFMAAASVPTTLPFAVAAGDVNGDDVEDLVVANYTGGSVSVMLGDGLGGFSAAHAFGTQSYPNSVALGDLDGDGDLDIVVANHRSDSVSVLLGNGLGGFGTQQPYATGGSNPSSAVLGDLNGDGQLDIAVVNSGSAGAAILLGDGLGGFTAATTFATGVNPFAVLFTNVNGDDTPEIAVVNDDAAAGILLGTVNGDFTGESYVIQQTPPTVTSSFSGTVGANGFFRSGGLETLTASAGAALTYTLDGGASTPYAGPFSIAGNGTHTVVAIATDLAGNSSQSTFTIKIDGAAPTVAGSFDGTAGTGGFFRSGGQETLTGSDTGGAGVVSITYTLDGGASTSYITPFSVAGDGTHSVVATVTDAAGNSSQSMFTIKIDGAAPTVAGSFSGTAGTGGFFRSGGLETLTGSDTGGSGVASISYTLDGGAPTPYATPFSIAGNGTHTVVATVTDVAGNSSQSTFTIKIDAAAPTVAGSFDGTAGSGGFFTTGGLEALTGSDTGGSGLGILTYTLDGGASIPYTVPFSIVGNGTHTVVATVTDVAGNSSQSTFTIKIDGAAPAVAGSFSGTAGTGGFFRSGGLETLTGSDTGGSGVASISYTLDGGASTPYTTPFSIAGNGTHTVVATVTDAAGNSSQSTFTIKIDGAAPTVAGSFDGTAGSGGFFTTGGLETLTGSDTGGSGLGTLTYTLDGGASIPYTAPFSIGGNGTHTVVATVTDVAGNSSQSTFTIKIDGAAPTVAGSFSGTAGTGGFFRSGGLETLTGSDTGGSGVASISYTLDGGASTPYASPFSIAGDGTHTVVATVTDAAGNSSQSTFTVTIDSVAPTVAGAFDGTVGNNGFFTSIGNETLTGDDTGGQGVGGITYRLDGGASTPYTVPFSITGEGAHTVVATVTDVAGNSSQSTFTFTIDVTAPAVTSFFSGTPAPGGVFLNGGNETLTATDPTSGVDTLFYTLDGGASTAYTAPFAITGDGTHTVVATVTDKAGNVDTKTFTITIDPNADPNLSYVQRLYLDVLGRNPDSAGLAHWSAIAATGNLYAVAYGVTGSFEAFNNTIVQYYQTYLGRVPDAVGFSGFSAQYLAGVSLEKIQIAILCSPEYYRTQGGGANAGWLTSVYQDILGRPIDSAGLAGFQSQLAAGATREQIVSSIINSTEEHNQLVSGWYITYLGRVAEAAGLTVWVAQLDRGGEEMLVLVGILGSVEYYKM